MMQTKNDHQLANWKANILLNRSPVTQHWPGAAQQVTWVERKHKIRKQLLPSTSQLILKNTRLHPSIFQSWKIRRGTELRSHYKPNWAQWSRKKLGCGQGSSLSRRPVAWLQASYHHFRSGSEWVHTPAHQFEDCRQITYCRMYGR